MAKTVLVAGKEMPAGSKFADGMALSGRSISITTPESERNGEEVLSAVLKDVEAFSDGEPQFDDITMMILTIGKKEM